MDELKFKKEVPFYCYIDELELKSVDFLKFWKDKIEKVPNQYRDDATILIEKEFDGHQLHIQVSYIRPLTEEEQQEAQAKKAESDAKIRKIRMKSILELADQLGMEVREKHE
jgi:hypothetical protein